MDHLTDYRLYVFDKQRHIIKATTLHLVSDGKAIEAARERAQSGEAVEVWHRTRLVVSLPSASAGAAKYSSR